MGLIKKKIHLKDPAKYKIEIYLHPSKKLGPRSPLR